MSVAAHAAPASVDLSIIVVNYNTAHLLEEMFAAVDAAVGALTVQVVVVDNASRDGSVAMLRSRWPSVDLIENAANVGFGRANNQALALARGRFLLLLNTDAFVEAGGIERSVRWLEAHPRCGVLGARLVSRDGTLQPSCRYFPTPWNEFLLRTGLQRWFAGARLVDDMAWDHRSARECDWVPGCYYLVRAEVVKQVGLFDPLFFLYYEEVDHCRAVKAAGWQVIYQPGTTVVHIGGESARGEAELSAAGRQIPALQIESALLYHRKHGGRIGLAANVALETLADALAAVRALLRGRSAALRAQVAHLRTLWALLARTRGAHRPTR